MNTEDGLMRRGGNEEEGLSKTKIESARRFLYDEDEPIQTEKPIVSLQSPSTSAGTKKFFPPPRSFTNPGTNSYFKNNERDNNRRRRGTFVAWFSDIASKHGKHLLYVIIFVGIIVGFTWGVVAISGNNNSDNAEHVNHKRINEFHKEIVDQGISSEAELESFGTPQYQALHWMANADRAKLKPNDNYAMQRYALAVLFFSTSGAGDYVHPEGTGTWINQSNWMTSKGICTWHGVLCKGQLVNYDDSDSVDDESKQPKNENNFVTGISLQANGLVGNIPKEIGALTFLSVLDLQQNNLIGSLPKKLSDLHELREMILRENDLTGIIPSDYGVKMSNMRQLSLGVNRLNGFIPKEIEHMVGLKSLGLERNQFQGTIPNLEDLVQLNRLFLESNNLDGPFPVSIAKLTSLVELNMSNNHLTGSLPDISELIRLEKLILNHLNLRGTIPHEIFKRVTRLTELSLQNNNLFGQIPTSVGHLKDVQAFLLSANNFSGTIPREIGLMADLRLFQIHGNKIRGTIPNIISALNNLEDMQISKNEIEGRIPSEVGNLHRLKAMRFESNRLSGDIPMEIGNIKSLRQIRLYDNNLSGTVPKEVCLLTSDEELAYLGTDCSNGDVQCDCCTKCF